MLGLSAPQLWQTVPEDEGSVGPLLRLLAAGTSELHKVDHDLQKP